MPSEAAEAAERPSLRTRQRGTLRGRQTASFLASNLPMARRETDHRLGQARLKPQRMWPLQLPLLSTGPPIIRCASILPRGAVEQRPKPFLAKPVRAFAFARATVMTEISAAIWAAMIYRRAAACLFTPGRSRDIRVCRWEARCGGVCRAPSPRENRSLAARSSGDSPLQSVPLSGCR